MVFSNTIGDGGLVLDGGAFKFTATNTFSGGLALYSSSTLEFSSDANLGAPGVAVTLSEGTLITDASLSLSRPISVTAYGAGFNTNGQTLTLTGTLTTAGGTITKTGAGTLVLAAATENIGYVTISQGEVQFNNTGTTGTTQVLVQSGGVLGGSGSVNYANLQSGAGLAPGGATPGQFFVNGQLLLIGGDFLNFRLGPSASDEIVMASGRVNMDLSGTGLVAVDISNAGGLAAGQTYTLLDWSAGAENNITPSDFQLSNGPVQGNFAVVNNSLQLDVTAVVPEPGSATLLAISGLFLLGTRYRVKRGPRQTVFGKA
jgi:fibronectin-binding autotransporter adhesin